MSRPKSGTLSIHAFATRRRAQRSQHVIAVLRRTLACGARRCAPGSPHMVTETRRTLACAARNTQRSPPMVAETSGDMRGPPADKRSALRT